MLVNVPNKHNEDLRDDDRGVNMLPDNAKLVDELAEKYLERFQTQLCVPAELTTHTRCLLKVLIAEAMFAESWGQLADAALFDPDAEFVVTLREALS
jgi:hypothetical protein